MLFAWGFSSFRLAGFGGGMIARFSSTAKGGLFLRSGRGGKSGQLLAMIRRFIFNDAHKFGVSRAAVPVLTR